MERDLVHILSDGCGVRHCRVSLTPAQGERKMKDKGSRSGLTPVSSPCEVELEPSPPQLSPQEAENLE